jgi:hypothetical protein
MTTNTDTQQAGQPTAELGDHIRYMGRHGHVKLGIVVATPDTLTQQDDSWQSVPVLQPGEVHAWILTPSGKTYIRHGCSQNEDGTWSVADRTTMVP